MELIETSPTAYETIFSKPYHAFNSAAFSGLNSFRCDDVKYLLFQEGKYVAGLISGIRSGMLLSPFSAPFAGFSFRDESVKIGQLEAMVQLTVQYAASRGLAGIRLILPPLFYADIFLSKLINVLYRAGFTTANLDLDYYFDLKNTKPYNEQIWYSARKNLQAGATGGLQLRHCTHSIDAQVVYEIIRENRAFKGFPITMTYDQIMATSKIITTDFFICHKEGINAAGAIVYHVTDEILYVPYWGDVAAQRSLRPMNFMAAAIFDHYKKTGKSIVHIGIATEGSQPNYGLCEFKESIGCKIIPKFTFTKMF